MLAASRAKLAVWLSRPGMAALAAAVVTLLVWFGPTVAEGSGFKQRWLRNGDTYTYRAYADGVADGKVPYRDFSVEYPPLALPTFVAPYLLGHDNQKPYRRAFVGIFGLVAAALAACVVLAVRALGRGLRDQLAAGGLVAVVPAILSGSIALTRYDLWPTLLVAVACLALIRRRPVWAATFAGLGTAAKLWPVLLLVPVLAAAWRWAGRAAAGRAAAAFTLACGIPFAVALAWSPHGLLKSIQYQTNRPMEIETLGATAQVLLHKLGMAGSYMTVHSYGSFNLVGSAAHTIAIATSVTGLVLAAAITLLGIRRIRARPPEAAASIAIAHVFAAVCATMVLGKVTSPQYMLWLLPFPFLIEGRRRYGAAVAILAVSLLTRFDVANFESWWGHLDTGPTLIVFARDLLLLGLAFLLVAPARRAEVTAGGPARLRVPIAAPATWRRS
jgi:uncharacterized membrane protein